MSGATPVKFFFMHVMKTAGTSFARHLEMNFRADEIYPSATTEDNLRGRQYWMPHEFEALSPEERASFRLFLGHFPYFVNELFGADLTITLLRDPIDRTISHLRHCKREAPDEQRSLEGIYEGAEVLPLPFVNFQVRQFALTSTDTENVPIIDATRYARAVANLEAVAVLGLTSHYGQFTQELTNRFNWSAASSERLQIAPTGPDVPDSFRRRLARDNEADIEFYQHARSLVERRARR